MMTHPPRDVYDIVIAGAGPAGSSAAIRLANAGLNVLIVEQKRFPREKLCGEFISPECLVHFGELGVLSQISAAGSVDISKTVFFARNGKGLTVPSEWFGNSGSLALGLSRAALDDLMLKRARETGVTVLSETKAVGLRFDNGRVSGLNLKSKNGYEFSVASKLIIDATGRTRSLARRIEKSTTDKKRAQHVAFKTHLRNVGIAADTCEIYAYRGGYGGCSRVENDLYNVCFIASAEDTRRHGSDAERVMRDVVCTNKRAAAAMQKAMVVEPWHAVQIESFGRASLAPANGLLTIGDAAAFIDPFTGSGILLALESSKITTEAITSGFGRGFDFDSLASEYRRNYAAAFDTRLRVCSMLRFAAFVPFFAETTIAVLSLSDALRRRVARATRITRELKVKK